jgi:hypothetical protein
MSVEVKKDISAAIIANLKAMISKGVYVGIPGDANRKDGKETNAEIAFIQEYGSDHKHIPARPFLRPALAHSKDKIIEIFQTGTIRALSGEDMHITMEKAGLYAQSQIKNFIVSGEGFKPLSPATIYGRQHRRKNPATAPTKPLIDTAQLLNSITYIIRDK